MYKGCTENQVGRQVSLVYVQSVRKYFLIKSDVGADQNVASITFTEHTSLQVVWNFVSL